MKPAQVRMARAAINWSLDELGKASGVHRNTISNFETGRFKGDADKLAAIQAALEKAGVIFVDENGEGPGVRLRKTKPKLDGPEPKGPATDVIAIMDQAIAAHTAKAKRRK